jgi:hypothetical protein
MATKEFQFGEPLTFGWETFKKNALFLIGLTVAVGVISGVIESADEYAGVESTYISFVLWVIALLVNGVLEMGLIRINLKFRDGITPEFGDLFSLVGLVLQYAVAAVLYGLMVVGGLILFIFPGIYLATRFCFFGYYIVEGHTDPFDALRRSSKLTEGVRMDLFLFGVMIAGLNILGILCLFVGLLVTVPVSRLAVAHDFRHLQAAAGEVPPLGERQSPPPGEGEMPPPAGGGSQPPPEGTPPAEA